MDLPAPFSPTVRVNRVFFNFDGNVLVGDDRAECFCDIPKFQHFVFLTIELKFSYGF